MSVSGALGGGSSSTKAQKPGQVWNQQGPYLQALFQNAYNTAASQYGGGFQYPGDNSGGSGSGPYDPRRDIQQGGHYPDQGGPPGSFQPGVGDYNGQRGTPPQVPGINTGQQPLGDITQTSAGLSSALLQGQGGYGMAGTNPAIANLMQRAQGGSPWLQSQIGQLGDNIGQFFNQQIMPGITGEYAGAGQLGGSRQAVSQGMASQEALRQFVQGATGLYSNDYTQGANAAGMAGQLAQGSINNAGNQYNLGMQPYSAQFQPLQQFSSLLGGPTVLGQGGGGGHGFNFMSQGSFGLGGMGGGGG